jgi:hypothetical protein
MTIKQLKVVNTTALNSQGTFEIGLRDNLLIKPNSKVGLKKFLLQQKPVEVFGIDIGSQTFLFSADAQGGGEDVSKPVGDKTITFGTEGLKFGNLYDLAKAFENAIKSTLVCGDFKSDIKPYVVQKASFPTNDAGLDVYFNVNEDSGNMELSFTSYALTDVIQNSWEMKNITGKNSGRGFSVRNMTTGFYCKGSSNTRLIEGSFQCYTQITQLGRNSYDYVIGLCDPSVVINTPTNANTLNSIDFGILKTDDNADAQWSIRDGGSLATIITGYTWAVGDYVVFFMTLGKLNLAIYPLDTSIADTPDAFRAGKTPKYTYTFQNYSLDDEKEYVPIITSLEIASAPTDPTERPLFSQFKSISTIDPKSLVYSSPNGVKRAVKLDFRGAKQLSNQLGFSSSTLLTPYSNYSQFMGSKDPDFNKLLDLGLFWSLPTQTYVATGDKTRNAKENMIASFTPQRQTTLSDTLYYDEEITYVDIGNLNEMNISSLSFRVVNEFPNVLNNVPETDYISFVLYIKDE